MKKVLMRNALQRLYFGEGKMSSVLVNILALIYAKLY